LVIIVENSLVLVELYLTDLGAAGCSVDAVPSGGRALAMQAVFITGETATGKALCAEAIHRRGAGARASRIPKPGKPLLLLHRQPPRPSTASFRPGGWTALPRV
jgi:hypothetical protein